MFFSDGTSTSPTCNYCSFSPSFYLALNTCLLISILLGILWSWSYGSWIYNYLCNQCLSPQKLLVRTPLWRGILDTTLCDKVYQW